MKGKLSKFLNKKKQQGATGKADGEAETKPEDVQQTAEVQEEKKVSEQPVKQEDSDESDDDLNVKGKYGGYTEQEEIKKDDQEDDQTKNAFGLNQLEEEAQPNQKDTKKKKTANDISFGGGKPSFGNKGAARNALKGFEDNLDEIDKVQTKKERNAQKFNKEPITRNAGPKEEAKIQKPSGPSRPTFTGKLKIGGGNQDGVKTNYDFTNTYKSDAPEQEDKARKPKKDKQQVFDIKGGNLDGLESHYAKQQADALDEDGFEVVGGGNDRKARRQQAAARPKQEDDTGFIVRNNDKRGGAFAKMNQ